MTNAETIQAIKAEIERRKGQAKEHYNEPYSIGRCDAFSEMLNFIDSLEEKSEKPMKGLEEEIVKVCDDFAFPLYGLDDEFGRELINKIAHHFAQWGYLRAAEKYDEIEYNRQRAEDSVPNDLEEAAWGYASKECEKDAFKAGAKWQAEQFEQNRLAACDKQTKEEYDREVEFATSIIEKEHRQPTFSDAINYGMKLQKQQMMKEAIGGNAYPNDGEIWVDLARYGYKFKEGEPCRIIIVKED